MKIQLILHSFAIEIITFTSNIIRFDVNIKGDRLIVVNASNFDNFFVFLRCSSIY